MEPIIAPALPPLFLERLQSLLPPPNLAAYQQAFTAPGPTALRVNRLKAGADEVPENLRGQGFDLTVVPGIPDAYSVPAAQRRALTESDAYRAGRLYIQNPSSMIPPLLLEPRPEDWVLDLTAAPGSKTTQLAAMMRNEGRISAVERSRSRFFRLHANLEQQGVTNTRTYLRDGNGVGRQLPERFDRVLLDAPCSAEGRFSAADPAPWQGWKPKRPRKLQRQQRRLLASAVAALKTGGVLVYSTCTFSPEENEAVLDDALKRFAGALEVEVPPRSWPNANPGLESWEGTQFDPQVKRALRLLPDGLMEGFFVARLRKTAPVDSEAA